MLAQFGKKLRKNMAGAVPSVGTTLDAQNAKKFSQNSKFKIQNSGRGGFTIVELVVVLSIILVLTTISVNAYLPFVAKVDYENLVLDVALNIRQFQLYGVATKQNQGGISNFSHAYGVRVEKDQNTVIFFEDSDDNKYYSHSGGSVDCNTECVKKITMNGYTVKEIKTDISSPSYANVTFKRPYLDSTIVTDNLLLTPTQVRICIQDDAQALAKYLKIVISRTGQISVGSTDSTCS